MFENEEFVYLTNKLKDSQKEDLKSFTHIYNIVNETEKYKRCPCEVSTNFIGPYRHGYSFTKLIYILKVEKEFTNDECLNFQLLNYDFGYKNIGIKAASKFYFNKNINDLNEEETITLVAMLKNSSLYNPIRNPEGVANRVKVFQTILQKHKK
ncbi:transglycosylase domain-containing protein [Flavobacterium sp. 9]|uniref:transglycosylase domain-containing protein n=1 Tax=Flavobacterium sp. 9 TaxID=2035198 RepID=UPI001E3AFA0E|nr:transglycosylase domain-containing protein [Flavobacterium sp. 9]